jgi:hypothetical protein
MISLGPFHFGYQATEDKGRRQPPKSRVYHESEILTKVKRKKLQATAQDQARNQSLVAWMVRKHLDYVSKFHFSFRTGKASVDSLVNRIFYWHGAPRNLDYLGRFGRDEMFRLFELEKVLCGDAGLLKLSDLKLQAIESDLIAKGTGAPENVNDSGLVVDSTGRVLQYAICNRGENGAECQFDHLEPTGNLIFDGYWNRFSSQFRGVSPLSTAINTVQDIHEAFEFNLIKAKMHALFGVAIYRDAQGDGNIGSASGANSTRAWVAEAHDWATGDYCTYAGKIYACASAHSTTTESAFATDLAAGKWTADTTDTGLDLDPRTINMLDLNPGEKAEVLESSTPSAEFVEGSYLFIQIAMLALDIPVTSFDSRRSSFSARIADLNEYEVSSDYKRTKNRYVRKEYSDWVLATIWGDDQSQWPLRNLAAAAGMGLRDVQEAVEWIPSGSPWLDKYSQIQGDQLGISIGLDNAIDACRRRGSDVFDNIDKQAQVIAYAKEKGVPLASVSAGERTAGEIDAAEHPDTPPAKGKKDE